MLGDNGIHDVVSNFEGVINIISRQQKEGTNRSKRWAENFTNKNICSNCNGTRLKTNSLLYKVDNKTIGEIAKMDIIYLQNWVKGLSAEIQCKSAENRGMTF